MKEKVNQWMTTFGDPFKMNSGEGEYILETFLTYIECDEDYARLVELTCPMCPLEEEQESAFINDLFMDLHVESFSDE